MATASVTRLLAAEEFLDRTDPGHPEELARERVVQMPPSDRRHGYVRGQFNFLLRRFVDASAVITQRGPDTVRGADICSCSYARLPEGRLPKGYGPEGTELVVDVRSPGERSTRRWVRAGRRDGPRLPR